MRHHDNYHDDHRVRAGERQSIFSSVDADRLLGKIILERQESDAVAETTGSCGTANTPSDRGATTIAILYPSRGMVSIEQIQRWAHDDLSNEEGRSAQCDIPAEFALAIVSYYGSVTLADGHGYSLPEWSAGDPVPSVRFIFDCKGHHPGPLDPMGETVYCDGTCRSGESKDVERACVKCGSTMVDDGHGEDCPSGCTDDGLEEDEIEVTVRLKYEVCSTCEGRGKHVNPSIDSNGISAEDFDEDPDFRESYFSGVYDVTCYGCKGQRVVLDVDWDNVEPAIRERINAKLEEDAQYEAECAAERRMGA